MLKNPSSSVVSVEIRILSLYPAPLEALDLLTKWYTAKSICLILQIIYSTVVLCLCCLEHCTMVRQYIPLVDFFLYFDWQVQYQPPFCQHQHYRVFSVGFSLRGKPLDAAGKLSSGNVESFSICIALGSQHVLLN